MAEPTPYRPWSRWDRIRQQVFERDGRTCQIRTHCEGAEATDVDHIIPWRDGGAWYELDNLQSSCGPCNTARASKQKWAHGWKRSDTELVVAMRGAPVTPDPADLIIDIDRLTAAITPTGADVTAEQRNAADTARTKLLREIRRGDLPAGRIWIVCDDPEEAEALPSHSLIVADTPNPEAGDAICHPIEAGRW